MSSTSRGAVTAAATVSFTWGGPPAIGNTAGLSAAWVGLIFFQPGRSASSGSSTSRWRSVAASLVLVNRTIA